MLIISLTHPATSCQRRWKTTIHNITIWLFLDTEGENRLYSGPKKGETLAPHLEFFGETLGNKR